MNGDAPPTKEGWGRKQSGFFKTWKQHWFSLSGSVLHVRHKPNGKESARIDLSAVRVIVRAPECRRQPAFKVCIPNVHTWTFVCQTDAEMREWIDTLEALRVGKPAASRPMRIAVRVGINDFSFVANIGRGSYGIVQLVRYKGNGELYAMKVMSKRVVAEYGQIEQILRERNVLLRLAHPFLVCAHFTFQTDTKIVMILDYVPGGELFARLKYEHHFSESRAKLYAAEILLGLGHLHGNGLAYRDLKPENILLDAEGHVRITDFGLVKPELTHFRSTTTTFCGTPQYMAPEVLLKQPYTKAVDWWAFGILVYEMLIGLPPFWDDNREVVYQKVLNDRVFFPYLLSAEAEDLILSLLDRDPATRLGAGPEDYEEIKAHPFFAGLFWPAVLAKSMETDWRPEIKHATDVSNFEEEFTQGGAGAVEEGEEPSPAVQAAFEGFSSTHESRL
jgi:serine/threonine protein kinase